MTRNEIIKAVFRVDSIDDLRDINLAIRQRWSELESRGTLHFRKGMSVKFSDRRGCLVTGLVEKVNRKTITVRAKTGMTWRVTPSLLSPLHKT